MLSGAFDTHWFLVAVLRRVIVRLDVAETLNRWLMGFIFFSIYLDIL